MEDVFVERDNCNHDARRGLSFTLLTPLPHSTINRGRLGTRRNM